MATAGSPHRVQDSGSFGVSRTMMWRKNSVCLRKTEFCGSIVHRLAIIRYHAITRDFPMSFGGGAVVPTKLRHSNFDLIFATA